MRTARLLCVVGLVFSLSFSAKAVCAGELSQNEIPADTVLKDETPEKEVDMVSENDLQDEIELGNYLYADSKFAVYFSGIERGEDEGELKVYLNIKNKTSRMRKISANSIGINGVSLKGWVYENVAPNSVGTVCFDIMLNTNVFRLEELLNVGTVSLDFNTFDSASYNDDYQIRVVDKVIGQTGKASVLLTGPVVYEDTNLEIQYLYASPSQYEWVEMN